MIVILTMLSVGLGVIALALVVLVMIRDALTARRRRRRLDAFERETALEFARRRAERAAVQERMTRDARLDVRATSSSPYADEEVRRRNQDNFMDSATLALITSSPANSSPSPSFSDVGGYSSGGGSSGGWDSGGADGGGGSCGGGGD